MDQLLRIFIFLSLCVSALNKPAFLTYKVFVEISVPKEHLQKTTIVSSPLIFTANNPLLLRVTAERNSTFCNASDPTVPSCPFPQLKCSISVDTNYRKKFVYSNDVPGVTWITINIDEIVNFTSSKVSVEKGIAEFTLDFQYNSSTTERGNLRKSGNSTYVSLSTEFSTAITVPDEDPGAEPSGQSALYHRSFWWTIPLVLLPAILLS